MKILSFFLISYSLCLGGTIIQIKDYLCGCDYCQTVPSGQPLDIASHMMLCDSQREGMLKTIQIMNSTKRPNLKDQNLNNAEQSNNKPKDSNKKNLNEQKYEWRKDNEGIWIFSDQNYLLSEDGWMFREDIGWLWSFNKKRFLYSERYGWLYNYSINNKRIYYWYDRRGWFLPQKLSEDND